MIVMGGIVGSGIFINPYVVAEIVHTPVLILCAWVAGGAIALVGAFIYAELATACLEGAVNTPTCATPITRRSDFSTVGWRCL